MNKGITLIGMPASGKATIGSVLAQKLNCPQLDIDEWMIAHEKMPITEILAKKGRDYVLDLELMCVQSHDLHETIVSPPGSIIYTNSLSKLREETEIVLLDVELEVIRARLAPDITNKRGVIGLADGGIEKLYTERMLVYRDWSDHIIVCAEKTPKEIADEILRLVG